MVGQGHWCHVEPMTPSQPAVACGELGPVLPESKSTVLPDLFVDTTYVAWEVTLRRLGVQEGT